MDYNKGEQLTVGKLKSYLSLIPDNVKVYVGIGDDAAPLHYLLTWNGSLLLHPDSYMQNADETNIKTVIKLQKRI